MTRTYEDFELAVIENIAEVAHEVNRAYCEATGDFSQPDWDNAPAWQKESAINGVKFHAENRHVTPEESHNSWLEEKRAAGWKWGPVKNPDAKQHPCMAPYDTLPLEQRVKDHLFTGVVRTMLKSAL